MMILKNCFRYDKNDELQTMELFSRASSGYFKPINLAK